MVTAAKQNAGTSFQAVWNKTQSNAQTTNAADGDRTQAGRNDVRRGESLRAGGRQRNNVADVSDGNKTMEDDSWMQRIWRKFRKLWERWYRT